MAAVTAAMVTAVMVATGTLITVVTVMAATEVVVTAMVAMDMVVITVIGMATGTGMVATGTDAVTVIGGMVAGGHMVSVPVGDWCAEAGSGFAIDRNADRQRQPGTPDPICGLIEAGRISSAIYRHQPPRLTEARFERETGLPVAAHDRRIDSKIILWNRFRSSLLEGSD